MVRSKYSGVVIRLVLALSLVNVGCGGGYSRSTQPSPQPSPQPSTKPNMQGSWEIVFQSDVSPNEPTALEMNLSQSGTHLTAEPTSVRVFQATGTGTWVLALKMSRFGGKCSSGADEVTFDGMLTDQRPVTQNVTFTLSENGALGSAVITASASTDGSGTLDGTYSIPAACGFPEDHGIVQGFRDLPNFSEGSTYAGTLEGHLILVRFAFEHTGFGVSAIGKDNDATLNLTGSTVGMSFNVTGTVSGQPVTWFGLFDSLYNTFRIYDSDAKLLGTLGNHP